MKMKLIPAAAIIFLAAACQNPSGEATGFSGTLQNDVDSVSYALGVNIATNIKTQGMESMNGPAMLAAITKVMQEDSNLLISNEEALQYLNTYFQSMAQQKRESEGAEERLAGEQFLADNAQREEVQVTPSGLQYEVIEEGSGAKPAATDAVKVHYHGTLADGTVFDSSVDRGEPITFRLNQVIPGWTEGLQLMSVGAKYKLYIPFNLAYGEQGRPPVIKPYAMLVFDVELIEINPAE